MLGRREFAVDLFPGGDLIDQVLKNLPLPSPFLTVGPGFERIACKAPMASISVHRLFDPKSDLFGYSLYELVLRCLCLVPRRLPGEYPTHRG